jgi:hypothetical protein
MHSQILALHNMGYSYLYSEGLSHTLYLYRMFPDLVKLIIAETDTSKACFEDNACVRNKDNPSGIPAWKIFSFFFWVPAGNPLGHKWTLSPEDVRPILLLVHV